MSILQEIINFDVKYDSPSGHISDFAEGYGYNQALYGSNHGNSRRSSNDSSADQHPAADDDDDDGLV